MDISVVIVSYNAVDFLRLTLNSVFAACKHIEAEVFVVDNNSTDGCPQMVTNEFPKCNLIANKNNPGFATANNQAIRQAKGKYILILNPDTVMAEDTLSKIVTFMDGTCNMGGVGIRMLDGSGLFLPESKRGIPSPWASFCKMTGLSGIFPKLKLFNEYHKGYLKEGENHPVEILAGAFMCFKAQTLQKIGLLDERFFMYGEDIDLSYRAIKAGCNNFYFADSSIVHFKGESTTKDKAYINRFYKAMIQFAEKHFEKTYGFILKVFIYSGVSLFRVITFFNHLLKKQQQTQHINSPNLLLLSGHLPNKNLIKKLDAKFNVKIIDDLSLEGSGTVLLVQGKSSYLQMVDLMDVYKDRFSYRFLDEKKNVMVGSDDKFRKGEVINL